MSAKEVISVVYDDRSESWVLLDNWDDKLNNFNTKKTALMNAKRFAEPRSRAIGGKVRLEVEDMDGNVVKKHVYEG